MATVKINRENTAKKGSILDRVTCMEDLFNELGIPQGQGLEITATAPVLTPLLPFISNEAKKMMVAFVLNEGWVPDWDDSNQRKWRPIFEYCSGSGFAFYASFYDDSGSGVGSRLYFKDEKTSTHAAKYFPELWTEENIK